MLAKVDPVPQKLGHPESFANNLERQGPEVKLTFSLQVS